MSQAKRKEVGRMTTTTEGKNVHATLEDIEAALKQGEDEAAASNQPDDLPNVEPEKKKGRRRQKNAEVAPDVKPYELTSFTARDVPWMKLGATLPEGQVVNAAQAAELGGLNFQVELLDAGFRSSDPDGTLARGKKSLWLNVPKRKACVRRDTQQFFSFVSDGYSPVQYAEAFAFMDEVSPEYVAAGTLGGGRQGFMIVQLPENKKVNLGLNGSEDPFTFYVVLRTSHDLTRAIEVSVLTLRDRCMNALTLSSFTRNAPQRWSVKHVGKDPMAKLDAARTTLARTDTYLKAFTEVALELSEIKLDIEGAKEVLTRLLPNRPKRDETVNKIVDAWQTSPTNGFRDNGWGLTNAVSEYFEWGRSDGTRTPSSRFTGGLTGATHRYTNRTAQLLRTRG